MGFIRLFVLNWLHGLIQNELIRVLRKQYLHFEEAIEKEAYIDLNFKEYFPFFFFKSISSRARVQSILGMVDLLQMEQFFEDITGCECKRQVNLFIIKEKK